MDNIKNENIPKPVRDGCLFSVSDDLRVARMEKMRALNQNGLLQEELDWQDVSYIADNLYMSGHIEHHKLEQILDKSQSRRKAVDSLVDAIIGNQSAVSAFMRILESENRFSYMAERIRSMEIASKVDLYKTVPSFVLLSTFSETWAILREKERVQMALEMVALEIEQMKNEGENQRINDSSAAGMQEMKLLKHYGLLQEELNWPDIISVADNLYKDGHLQCHELEKIKDRSQPRRKAIDILFRLVLGNASSVSAFMKIMKSNRKVSYKAERINMTQISIKEMKRFHILKGNQQGQSQSTYQEQSIQFSEAIHRLNKNEDVIDQFSDSLLSAFQISISDHTRILEQAYVDGKIHELADLIKTCPDGVYDVFVEVVTKNNLEHVLESFGRNQMVNNKRKYLSFDNDYSPAQKCTRIDHNHQGGASEAVEKIASGLRVDTVRQKVAKASKDLGLEFKEAFGGPLGLSIAFKLASPHKRLRQPFA